MSGGFITAAGWFTARSLAVVKRKPQLQRGRAAAPALAAGGWRVGEGGCLFLVSFPFTGHFLAVNFVIIRKRRKKRSKKPSPSLFPGCLGSLQLLCIIIFSSLYGRKEMASREVRAEKYFAEWLFLKEGFSPPGLPFLPATPGPQQ